MTRDLLAVLDDGSTLGSGVPSNPRVPIRMTLGTTLTLRVKVIKRSGEPIDLTGATLALTVKKSTLDAQTQLSAVGAITAGQDPSVATFSIAAADTKFLDPGRYVYDVWLTDASANRDPVIPVSPFVIEPAALLP